MGIIQDRWRVSARTHTTSTSGACQGRNLSRAERAIGVPSHAQRLERHFHSWRSKQLQHTGGGRSGHGHHKLGDRWLVTLILGVCQRMKRQPKGSFLANRNRQVPRGKPGSKANGRYPPQVFSGCVKRTPIVSSNLSRDYRSHCDI